MFVVMRRVLVVFIGAFRLLLCETLHLLSLLLLILWLLLCRRVVNSVDSIGRHVGAAT